MEKPQATTTFKKINMTLKEMGYRLESLKHIDGVDEEAFEKQLLEVIIGFKYGQFKSAADMLLTKR